MKYYLVTGRLFSEDADHLLLLRAESRAAAKAAFVEDIWDYKGIEAEDRARLESHGTAVLINGIFESEAEIKEST